jgi:hypothetical protein
MTEKTYTIGMRRKSEPNAPLCYVNTALKVVNSPVGCKPLTREEARLARSAMLAAGKKVGETLVVSIVELPA